MVTVLEVGSAAQMGRGNMANKKDDIAMRVVKKISPTPAVGTTEQKHVSKETSPAIALEWAKPGVVGKPFNLARTTIFRLMAEGRIRSAKIGRTRLVSTASLRAYIEFCAETPENRGKNKNLRVCDGTGESSGNEGQGVQVDQVKSLVGEFGRDGTRPREELPSGKPVTGQG